MHQQYTVIYGRMNLLIWALILVPTVPMFVFVAVVLQLPELNSTLLLTGILGCMALSVALLLWLIKKHISTEAVVTPTDAGLEVELVRTNLYYRQKNISISIANIRNFSLNYDVRSGKEFLVLRLVRDANLQIAAAKHKPDDLAGLHSALMAQRQRYNSNPAMPQPARIGNQGFYESTFGRMLTGAMVVGTILVTVNQLVGTGVLPWYKVIWWYAIAAVWLINVWYAKQRAGKNRD